MNRPASLRLPAAVAGLTAAALGLLLAPGCTKPPTPPKSDNKSGDAKADPWGDAARRLRREADLGAAKSALGQLNNDLATRQDVPRPDSLGKDAEAALAATVPLNPTDLDEIRPATFTSLDPVYVADCLYLRDAARSVEVAGLPQGQLAELAFAWVCRQVYVNPWRLENPSGVVPAVPPTYVLRRGSGSGLERAYVFLALLQQLGLDGCLVGPPEAADRQAGFAPPGPDGKALTGSPKGPFWAVGVRVGADVLLFEPWRGSPFPGPEGKGTATLAQVKANPDLLKAWAEDKANPLGVSPEDAKKATVFLAVPVSSLAPRTAFLEERLRAEVGVRLAFNPAALRDRFTAAAPNGPGLPVGEVRFWNPPADRFAYGRVLPAFLPLEEGGQDRTEPPPARLFGRYQLSLLPRSVVSFPPELREQGAKEKLLDFAAGTYAAAFFAPPTPRERIQRGQFQEASRFLAEKQDGFVRGLERLRTTTPEEIAAWCEAANRVYADLGTARLPGNEAALPSAQAAVDQFWKTQAHTAQVIVDRASARVGLAEAAYLLALTKHEQAERQQALAGRATGADADRARAEAVLAWKEAANAWASYTEHAGQDAFPGRLAHAKALAARAAALAGGK